MKQERVILSFIAVLIGLLVAGALFYFYQSTKVIPTSNTDTTNLSSPTPTEKPTIFLSLSKPENESVVTSKTLSIQGKVNPDATVIIITDSGQEVISPSAQGDFSTTVTIEEGQNLIEVRAILPNGETTKVERTVTYSTEEF